jgi:hypothetical protein
MDNVQKHNNRILSPVFRSCVVRISAGAFAIPIVFVLLTRRETTSWAKHGHLLITHSFPLGSLRTSASLRSHAHSFPLFAVCLDIVGYRPVTRQRPRNKRVQPLLCNRRINKRHFRCGPRRGVMKKTTGGNPVS